MVHRQLGHKQLRRVTDMLGKLATIENPARMEGRFLSMILVSNKEGVAEARREMEAAAKAEAEALANEEVAEARPE